MNTRDKNSKLNEFYNASANEQDEKSLKESLINENNFEGIYTRYAHKQKVVSDNNLNSELEKLLQNKIRKTAKIRLMTLGVSVAAAVILIFALVVPVNVFHSKSQLADTYTNPQEAYEKTYETLAFVSQAMNKSTEPLNKLDEISSTLESLQKIGDLNNMYIQSLNDNKK